MVWNQPRKEKKVYLTFDDGPTPEITDWVLDVLAKYKAKASFFVIGKNVEEQADIYQRIIDQGHTVGNHTQNHKNGWKTPVADYLENVRLCEKHVESKLFRPPYGRIRPKQIKALKKQRFQIMMWDVLSADFDVKIDGEQCYQNVVKNTQNGSILVFHDSVKAFPRLKVALPKTLETLASQGYEFCALGLS